METNRHEIVRQLLTTIERGNVDKFHVAFLIALAQEPPIDLNQIHQSGHTFLTFAVSNYNPSIISSLLNEVSLNANQVNAFNMTAVQVAAQNNIGIEHLQSAVGLKVLPNKPKTTSTKKRKNAKSSTIRHNCPKCAFTSKYPPCVVVHMRTHLHRRPFACDVCDKTFVTQHVTDRHKLHVHSGKRPFVCDYPECTFATVTRHSLADHKRRHSSVPLPRPFKCSYDGCTATCITAHDLKQHQRIHSSDRPHKCDFEGCNYACISADSLRSHKRVHTGEKPYACDLCNAVFAGRGHVRVHKQGVHGVGLKEQNKLNCSKCDYTTYNSSNMTKHMATHSTERPFVCKMCNSAFVQEATRATHHRDVHGMAGKQRKLKCTECDFSAYNRTRLAKHMLKHTGETPYKCDECNSAYRTLDGLGVHKRDVHGVIRAKDGSLVVHNRRHAGDRPFKCSMCPSTFFASSNCKTHMKTHTGEKSHKCTHENCTYAAISNSDLQRHLRTHTGEKPLKCQVCPKRFASTGNLRNHARTHTGEKNHQCNICLKRFATSGNLVTHRRTHSKDKPFKCDICNAVFKHSYNVGKHKRTVHNIGQKEQVILSCTDCEYTTTVKHSLIAHTRTHTNERPFKCQHIGCSHAAKAKNDLLMHIRTHTGERPYKCTECQKGFSNSGNLRLHMRQHTNEKPYKCGDCNKAYANSPSLVLHKMSHTGEKPHKCKECKYACTTASALVVHNRRHTGERPFQCTKCNQGFTCSSNFIAHMRKFHS